MSEKIESYRQRIKDLQDILAQSKEQKIRLETNLQQAEKNRDEVVAEIVKLGYTPENIVEAIAEKSEKIDKALKKLEEEVLPSLKAPDQDVMF